MAFSLRAAGAALVAGAGVLALAGFVTPVPQQAAPKFAIIQGRTLLKGAPGTAEAEAMLQRETAAFEADIGRMADSLNAIQLKYRDDEATLSPTARAARQKEIQDRYASYQRRGDSLKVLAERRQSDLLQPVIDLVNKVLQSVRDEEGYSMIFDIGADGQGIVAYDKNLDITDRVLAKVKQQPAPKLPPTVIKPGTVVKPPPPPPHEPR